MVKNVISTIALVISAVAVIAVGTASAIWIYQPKTPKCLSR